MAKSKSQRFLGENLKKIRKSRNMSQESLAFKLGISAKHLGFIETGKSFVSAELLDKIAESLSIPIYLLFYKAEENAGEENEVLKKKALISEVEKIMDDNFLSAYEKAKRQLRQLTDS